MAKEVQNSRSGEIKKTAEDLDEFLNRVCDLLCIPMVILMTYLFIYFNFFMGKGKQDKYTVDSASLAFNICVCVYIYIL